jgi:branched-subunit amino acid permease
MEKYKRKLKTRILFMSLAIILAVILLIFNSMKMVEAGDEEPFSSGFIDGFQSGLLAALVGIFCVFIINYLIVMKDERKLRLLYNRENDERRKQIKLKSGGNVVLINSIIIIFAGIIAGYFNEIVFFSLIGCALFQLLMSTVIKVYLLQTH